MSAALTVADAADRADLGSFVARVVRLDQTATVLLRGSAPAGSVTAWATTPFDVLATRTAVGSVTPGEVVVPATGLLTALTVERADTVDPGAGGLWPADDPPTGGWTVVDEVPAAEIDGLTERGLAVARENAGPLGPPSSLLDQVVLTVSPRSLGDAAAAQTTGSTAGTAAGPAAGPATQATAAPVRGVVRVPLRCLFALSGMGFVGSEGDPVRVSATGTWLRLDARYGAVARRRTTALPLMVS